MSSETIDHGTLAALTAAGAVRSAHVVGEAGGWSLRVEYGADQRVLTSQRSRKARVFRRLETLVSYLKEIGIERFDVDAAGHQAGTGPARPDRARALRHAHEAAAHDRWFRDQVQAGIAEADDPATEWAAHDAVTGDMARLRAGLEARIRDGKK